MNTPCKDCTERKYMCHSHCEGYKDWKKRLQEIKDSEKPIKQANQMSYDNHIRICKRMRDRRR